MQQLACLRPLVGISPLCDTERSTHVRYLDDLEHISIDLADAAMNSGHSSGLDLLQRKIDLAADAVAQDVRAFLRPRANLHSAVANDRAGLIQNNRRLADHDPTQQAGLKFYSRYSQYFEFYIHTITAWFDATETITVNLYDLTTGQTLDTYTIDAVQDVPTQIVVNRGYFSNRNELEIALVAATTASPYHMAVYMSRDKGCRGCDYAYGNQYISINGTSIAVGDAPIKQNASGINNSGGLSVDYSLQCSLDKFICNMGNLIATPMLYRAAEMVYREVRYNKSLAAIVRLYTDDFDDLIEYSANQYKNGLKNVLDTMYLPNDSCFSCSPAVGYKTYIP